jgi:electron transport complex protein RnfD
LKKRGDYLSVQKRQEKRQQKRENVSTTVMSNPVKDETAGNTADTADTTVAAPTAGIKADTAAAVPTAVNKADTADTVAAVPDLCEAANLTAKRTDRDSLLILFTLAATAVFYYGNRAGIIIGLSLVTAVAADFICTLILKKPRFSGTLPAIITGLINALILPSSVPFSAVVIGGIVSIVLLRYTFGGVSHEIINPSAGALLFLYYAFPGKLSVYVPIFTDIGTEAVVYPKTTDPSFFYRLINSRVVTGDFFDLLTGRLSSVMGGCVLIALVAGFIYVIRRDISGISLFTASACFFSISFLYTKDLVFALYALAGVLPAIVFTALMTTAYFSGRGNAIEAKALYGILLGAVCALFIWYSRNEYGGFFACVILSPLAAYLSTHRWDLTYISRKLRRIKLSRE